MLGWQEIILILAILLLVVGPAKLPEIAKELGNALREFRRASAGVSDAIINSPVSEPADRKKAIFDIANKLGVKTEDKTEDEIVKQIATSIESREETSVVKVNEVKN